MARSNSTSRSRRGKSKRSNSSTAASAGTNNNNNPNDNDADAPPAAAAAAAAAVRQLPEHVRSRQRAVAEREAARLARPEQRPKSKLGHADRKKSAVTSTPFGILAGSSSTSSPNGRADSSSTSWCGPFTVARQMIAAREEAKRKRLEAEDGTPKEGEGENHPLDAAMAELEEEQRQKAHPSLLWKSRCVTPDAAKTTTATTATTASGGNRKSKKARLPTPVALLDTTQGNNRVKSLYQMCIDFVVTNFDAVESLGDVDHTIRTSIAHDLSGQNRLDAIALKALVEPNIEALEFNDCSNIPQEALVEALKETPTALRYLVLDQAGRCFGKLAVETLLNPFQKHATTMRPMPLFALHIGGAYLFQDVDAAKLVQHMASTIQSIAFKACPLLGLELCRSISTHYNNAEKLLLEFSLEDMTLSRECLDALIGKSNNGDVPTWPHHLKNLTLRRVTGLQDDVVVSILKDAPELEHLDLSDNHELTDACLSPLRLHATPSKLRTLHLYNLKNITDIGLETLFTHGLEGMGPPPQLKVINLSHLHWDAVTDDVMELILQSASRKPSAGAMDTVASAAAVGGLSLLGGMVEVNLEGSKITDTTLERLAATSAKTLQKLNVSFCPHITDQGLGYLVDTVGNQLESVEIWGTAQVTELFWNGHARVAIGGGSKKGTMDSAVVVPLQITGAWMKKSGIASIRS